MKKLINKEKSLIIKCKYCKENIDLKNTYIRDITGFNDSFIKKINKLKE